MSARCAVCGLEFGSDSGFDRHRRGPHTGPAVRRCLNPVELAFHGWTVDSRGRWRQPRAMVAVPDPRRPF